MDTDTLSSLLLGVWWMAFGLLAVAWCAGACLYVHRRLRRERSVELDMVVLASFGGWLLSIITAGTLIAGGGMLYAALTRMPGS